MHVQRMMVHEAHIVSYLTKWLKKNAPRVKILADDDVDICVKTPPEMYVTLAGWSMIQGQALEEELIKTANQDAQAWAVSSASVSQVSNSRHRQLSLGTRHCTLYL